MNKRVWAYTTPNLPRTARYVKHCSRVKFNDARKNHWQPLFALISLRILLKQLDYSLSKSQAHNLTVKQKPSTVEVWKNEKCRNIRLSNRAQTAYSRSLKLSRVFQ